MASGKLEATQNYVYSADDYIGKGATCEVYKGIHKGTGEVHALKIFNSRLHKIAEREIEALRTLEHENIVAFMGEETDRRTHRVVAVMEYCDKSLYKSLCEPENKFGLNEEEFIRFFNHTVKGMKHLREHGFLHRDIKPGNILIAQDENGSNIYKLSDFGTAKPVLETEAFQSLVGTEEYLHPNIFKAAFIDNGMTRQFDSAADLWSLGATLYHAATGCVPFKPYEGRVNKAMMYQMIAQKEFGVIAGEQRSYQGEIIWTKELPSTCRFSRWLKDALADILQHLLEGDPNKAMTFDTFFTAANDIVSRHVFYVFSTTSAKHFRLYLRNDCVYSDVQQEIYTETNIPARDQILHYEECLLRDIVSDTQQVTTYPRMSELTPLVMIRSTNVEQCTMPEEKHLWYNQPLSVFCGEFKPSDRFLDEDVKVGKSICDSIASVQSNIQLACLTQELFEKIIDRTERWKEVLISRLQMEVELYRDRIKDLRHIHKAIMENGAVQCVTTTDGLSIEDLKSRINNCSVFLSRIQNVQTDSGYKLYQNSCVHGNKCQKKIVRIFQQAIVKRNLVASRQKHGRHLEYHEEQLHKFDRVKLTSLYNEAIQLWMSHCAVKLTEIHNHFLQWHRTFAELQTHIESLQKEIRNTKSTIKKYMRSFKVSSEPGSMMCTGSIKPVSSDTSIATSPTPNDDDKRRHLTSSLITQLDAVKTEQAEMKRMMSENEQLQIKSMEMISLDDSFPTMTSEESPNVSN
ncbi:hypothetical protein ACF0H5_014368 [Mactra antiquata]